MLSSAPYPYCAACSAVSQQMEMKTSALRGRLMPLRMFMSAADKRYTDTFVDIDQLRHLCATAQTIMLEGRSSTFNTTDTALRQVFNVLTDIPRISRDVDRIKPLGGKVPDSVAQVTLIRYTSLLSFVHVHRGLLDDVHTNLQQIVLFAQDLLAGLAGGAGDASVSPTGITSPSASPRSHVTDTQHRTISARSDTGDDSCVIEYTDLQVLKSTLLLSTYIARLAQLHTSSFLQQHSLHNTFKTLLHLVRAFDGVGLCPHEESRAPSPQKVARTWLIEVLSAYEDFCAARSRGAWTEAVELLVHCWRLTETQLPAYAGTAIGFKFMAAKMVIGHLEEFSGVDLAFLAHEKGMDCDRAPPSIFSAGDAAIELAAQCLMALREDPQVRGSARDAAHSYEAGCDQLEETSLRSLESAFDLALPVTPHLVDVCSLMSRFLYDTGRRQEAFTFAILYEGANKMLSPLPAMLGVDSVSSVLTRTLAVRAWALSKAREALLSASDAPSKIPYIVAVLHGFLDMLEQCTQQMFSEVDTIGGPAAIVVCRQRSASAMDGTAVNAFSSLQLMVLLATAEHYELLADISVIASEIDVARRYYGWAWYLVQHVCNIAPEMDLQPSARAGSVQVLHAPELLEKWIRASFYAGFSDSALRAALFLSLAINCSSLTTIPSAVKLLHACGYINSTGPRACALSEDAFAAFINDVLSTHVADSPRSFHLTMTESVQVTPRGVKAPGFEDFLPVSAARVRHYKESCSPSVVGAAQLPRGSPSIEEAWAEISPEGDLSSLAAGWIAAIKAFPVTSSALVALHVLCTGMVCACLLESGNDRAVTTDTLLVYAAEDLGDIAYKCFVEALAPAADWLYGAERMDGSANIQWLLEYLVPRVPLARAYTSIDAFSANMCLCMATEGPHVVDELADWLAQRLQINYSFAVARRICHLTISEVKPSFESSVSSPRLGVYAGSPVARSRTQIVVSPSRSMSSTQSGSFSPRSTFTFASEGKGAGGTSKSGTPEPALFCALSRISRVQQESRELKAKASMSRFGLSLPDRTVGLDYQLLMTRLLSETIHSHRRKLQQ